MRRGFLAVNSIVQVSLSHFIPLSLFRLLKCYTLDRGGQLHGVCGKMRAGS